MTSHDMFQTYGVPLVVFGCAIVGMLILLLTRPVLSRKNVPAIVAVCFLLMLSLFYIDLYRKYQTTAARYEGLCHAVDRLHDAIAGTNDPKYIEYVLSHVRSKIAAARTVDSPAVREAGKQ